MYEQKILQLASNLLLASATNKSEDIKKISSELAEALRQQSDGNEALTSTEEEFTGFLKFTKGELQKMPATFRKYFRAEGLTVFYRKRIRGKRSLSYEARYRRHGYNISRSAPTLELLKERFIEALKEADGQTTMPNTPTRFEAFANYYFENFYKRKVSPATFKTETGRYANHIKPYFGNIEIKRITPLACQRLLDELQASAKGKTCAEVKSILNGIFTYAIKHGIVKNNPLDLVFYKQYNQQHGKALTKDEEGKLLQETAGTPYQLMFAVALYTGLRPNEYKTAHVDGKFIVARNSKRKNGKIEYKKIPITAKLKPYLDSSSNELAFYGSNRIGEKFRAILPNHKLYDLRTTFYTRCQECGVTEIAIKKFVGHNLNGLAETYTDLSDEYLLKEGAKLNY